MRLVTVLAILAALTGGCSSNSDPTTAAYWLERLEDKAQRTEALKELGKIGDKAAVPVVLELFQTQGDWQPDAAYVLGQLGDASVVPQLVAGIDYQVGTGRDAATTRRNRTNQNIARALALLKAKDGVEPLVKLLETPELKTREAVITALGAIGDGRAAAPLIDIALNETHPFIRKTAIVALGELGDPKAVSALIQNLFIELPGTSFYFEARHALLQIGQAAVPELMTTLQRKNRAVEAIELPSGERIADGAIEAKAAFVLGELRATEAEQPMIDALQSYYGRYKKASGPVFAGVVGAVMELCYALGTLGSQKAVPVLERVLADTDPNLRVAAAEALTAIGSTGSVGALLKAASTGSADARRVAIEAASRLGDGKALEALKALAKAGGGDVSADAMAKMVAEAAPRLEAAAACGADAACWRSKLQDPNPVVRERAALELGWRREAGAVADLLKAAEDERAEVRLAAVSALGRLEGLDANVLEGIYERWKDKIAYKDVNANLQRLAARVRAVATPKP